jgi:hypothetical protein
MNSNHLNPQNKVRQKIIIIFFVLLCLIPIIRLFLILSTNGSNNLENDVVEYLLPMEKMLKGNYSWTNIFYDTFKEGHSNIFPVLIQVLFAYLTDWNVFAPIYFRIILSCLKLILLFDAMTYYYKTWTKWLLLPILSF